MMQEEEIIYEDLQMSEVQNDTIIEEVIQVVEVTDVETFDIEMSEAFPASGEIDALNHALLYHRELDDAHPISAITGLREELNSIEALQTIYSDKKGNADYYEWADGHAIGENGIGYFVTLNKDRHISICTGDDIFGVVVDSAAFVGGQDDVARDDHYGLVATTGVVPVRRELDVAEGDHVVSNSKGWAAKATSDYGYKVVALRDIQGVPHAIIKLNISADQMHLIGAEIQEFDSRMDAAETNIVSAVNVANQAYQKATEAGSASTDASNKAQNALDTSNKVLDSVGSLENAATQSQIIAAQAKAIAEGTMVSAEAMCKEAVDEANKALVEAEKIREEFNDIVGDSAEDLSNAVKDLKQLKEDLTPLATWPEGTDIESATGYAGFVAQANEDSSILGTMVGRKGEQGETLAGFIQEAEDTRATVKGIVSYEYTDKDGKPVTGAAGLMAQVDATQSEVSAIANREFTKNDGTVVTGLAGLNAYVNENESNVSLVANRVAGKYTIIPELVKEDKRDTSKIYGTYDSETKIVTYYYYTNQWNSVTDWVSVPSKNTSTIYYVSANKLYWYYDNNIWKSTDDAYTAGLPSAIAGIQVETDDNSSSINSLTSWQGETNISMARIEQKADANGAYIQSTVANLDRYAVGPYSQAYGFTLEQAAEVLEEGMIYAPTTSHTEKYKYTDTDKTVKEQSRNFVPRYLYKWGKVGTRYGWITVDKNYNETTETNTSGQAVYFTTEEPTVSGNFGYWYTDGDTVTGTIPGTDVKYEPYTLYKWTESTATIFVDGKDVVVEDEDGNPVKFYHWAPVATLAGNSSSRAVSQIRQDANSIEMSVTSMKGDVASSKQWITDNDANIQATVKWKGENADSISTFMNTASENFASASQVAKIVDKDGNVIESSIVTAVNNNASSIYLSADNITFEGFASFKAKVEDVEDKSIYDTKVEYALSSSLSSFVKATEWSTVAPAHQSGKYMWQRTTITKGDGTTATSDPTCIHGADGISISSTTVTYGVSTSASVKPTEWQSTMPTVPEGSYLWTCTVTDYTNDTDTVTYTYAKQGKDGYTPVKDIDYKDGTSVTVSSIQYQAGASATTTPTGTWSNSVVSASEGQYLWSKTTFSDGNVVYGVTKQGSSGKGIKNVVNYYLATNSSSGITTSTSGWTDTVQSVSSSNKYLWNYEVVTYTDNSTKSTDPCVLGSYGDDGNGISDVVEYYQVSTSNTSQPTTWVEKTPPALSVTNKYLWNYEKIVYTNGTDKTTTPCVIGAYGDTGANVKSEKKQFYLSTSNTSCTGGSWDDSPSGFTKGKYLWTRSVYILTDDSTINGDAVLDKTYTTISSWCSANDETLIDGANIATGTVTAEQIDVDSLVVNNKFVATVGGSINEAVDNISIGGSNLLPKSKLGAKLKAITTNSNSGFGYICPTVTTGDVQNLGHDAQIFGQTLDLDLKSNTEYTVSFTTWLNTTDTSARQKLTWDLWPDELPQEFLEVTSVPTRHSWTISSPEPKMLDAILRVFVYEADSEGYFAKYPVYVTDIQIEEGNVASSWTPAPEDTKDETRNLALNNLIQHSFNGTVEVYNKSYPWSITKSAAYDGSYIDSSVFTVGETYTLSYRFKKTGGTLENIGGHIGGATEVSFYLDGERKSGYPGQASNVNNDTNEHYVVFTFIYDGTDHVYIQPNRGSNTSVTYDLWNIKLEKGTTATAWSPAPEDIADRNYVKGELVLEVREEDGEKYAYLGGKADKIKFDATKTIEIDAPNFKLDAEGKMTAKGGGEIGGFTIGNTYITSNTSKTTYKTSADGVYVGTDGIGLGKNAFYVDKEGKMYAKSGTIGGWTISDMRLSNNISTKQPDGTYKYTCVGISTSNTTQIASIANPGTTSAPRFFAGAPTASGAPNDAGEKTKFMVLEDGSLYASAAKIEGTIIAKEGFIGNLKIEGNNITAGDSASGITLYSSPNDKYGYMDVTSAYIGGWKFNGATNSFISSKSPSYGQTLNTLEIETNEVFYTENNKATENGNGKISAYWGDIIRTAQYNNTLSNGETITLNVGGTNLKFKNGILIGHGINV